MRLRIGIDIGGTKISLGVVDEDGKVLFFERTETQKEKGYGYVKDKVINLIDSVIRTHGLSINNILRIGIACAGQVDIDSGVVKFSPNLKWRNVPLKNDIQSHFSVETVVENDVNAATYGEWKFSYGSIPENMVGVFLGTGVGGGIIVSKKLFRGTTYVGGELGHMILNPYGYLCNCGSRGCFEAFCGGDYIIRRVLKLMEEGYRGKIWEISRGNDNIYISHVEKAYYLGDKAIKKIWEEVIEYFGCALSSILNVFNPEIVVVGGGIINGTVRLLTEAKKIVGERAMSENKKHVRIEKAQLGDSAAIIGVAFLE